MILEHTFQLVTVFLALVCIGLKASILKSRDRLDFWLFWAFGVLFVSFAALRPLGAGVDDIYGYSTDQFARVCPTLSCGIWIQGDRDEAWYSLIGLLKSIAPFPRIQLLLVAAGLGLKLWVISMLTQNRTLALLVYVAFFYIIHDITALRVSLAISIYLGAFYTLTRGYFFQGSIGLMFNGFFHKQAFLAPLLVLGCWIPWSRRGALFLCGPVGLLMAGIYPGDKVFDMMMSLSWGANVVNALFGANYVAGKLAGVYDQVRVYPLVAPPAVLLATWLIRDLDPRSLLFRYTATSILLAVLFLWGYAVIPEVQLRFWHFFLVPIVFVVGNARLSSLKFAAVLVLSAIYIIKYTALHHLLLDQRSITISNSLGGSIKFISAGTFVDDQTRNFNFGSKAEVRALPNEGYRFGGWRGDCSDYETVCVLEMTQDRRVDASFKRIAESCVPN